MKVHGLSTHLWKQNNLILDVPVVLALQTDFWEKSHCYDHVTPCDGNTDSFSKVQTWDSTNALRDSAQGRSIIKQVPNDHQNDLLLRQWNNESSRRAQTPREWEVWRLMKGGAQSKNPQSLATGDQWQTAEKTADQWMAAETHTQTTTICPRAVELQPQYTTVRPTRGKSCPW
jgi:hypothetical protein